MFRTVFGDEGEAGAVARWTSSALPVCSASSVDSRLICLWSDCPSLLCWSAGESRLKSAVDQCRAPAGPSCGRHPAGSDVVLGEGVGQGRGELRIGVSGLDGGDIRLALALDVDLVSRSRPR